MRIERINEHSIRCVLTNFDLSVRNVKLSELTYGSEGAKNLFREMMQKASREVGFEAEDVPIMVEAIPMANDSIMLIITKIDDPEELDTRFSRFAPSEEEEAAPWNNFPTELLEGADEILNLLGDPALLETIAKETAKTAAPTAMPKMPQPQTSEMKEEPQQAPPQNVRIYQFDTLDLVCAAAKETRSLFSGESVLYKNPVTGKFYLLLKKEACDEISFNKTCNRLSEYASRQKYDPAAEAYFAEHYELFVKRNVLQVLADL